MILEISFIAFCCCVTVTWLACCMYRSGFSSGFILSLLIIFAVVTAALIACSLPLHP